MDNRHDPVREPDTGHRRCAEDSAVVAELRARQSALESQNEALLLSLDDLAKRERRLRIFLENSYDVLFTLDAKGRIIFVSPAWERHFGYPVMEITGKLIFLLVHPDDVTTCRVYLSKVLNGTYAQVSPPFRVRHADGSWRVFEANGMPYVDVNGTLMFTGAAHDITERIKAEERLREGNERFDQLAEQSGTIIWETNSQGMFTHMSHLSEPILGIHPDNIIGKMHFYDLYHESGREVFKNSALAAMERKQPFKNIEYCFLSGTGEQKWFSSNGIPLLSDDGILLGYRGSYSDVTESRKLKEQLYQSQKMEAVGELAGGLAHDFNNVLSIINGYCCMMQMEMEPDNPHREYIERVHAASGRAGDLTRNMLAFSRTQEIIPYNQNLNSIVATVGSFTKRIIGEHIHFTITTCLIPLPVHVDGGQIEQVLINLVNNAKDAMPQGGTLTIGTDHTYIDSSHLSLHGVEHPGEYAVVTVTDSGIGMDEYTASKIFEPFFTTKEVGKGTGLGLAMVYGIVKQHHGFIEVCTKPGEGSRFELYLPIINAPSTIGEVMATVGVDRTSGSETILLVEDDADVLEFMDNLLTKMGYRVITASDGREAVKRFQDHADLIGLIIMDMILPHLSGKQAYDEIVRIKADTRVLFCSGYCAKAIQQQGSLGRHADFISKPVPTIAFLRKVRELLDN